MLVALVDLGPGAGYVGLRCLEHVLEPVGAAVVPVLGKARFDDQQPQVRILGSTGNQVRNGSRHNCRTRDGSCTIMPMPDSDR